MGIYDRDWARAGVQVRDPLEFTVPLFRVAGIRVELHLLFLVFLGFELLRGAFEGTFWFTAQWLGILWASVLLHEFGHCWGARVTGGTADRILMWPLGGLAFVAPPERPGASLVCTVAGPAVNLLLMIAAAIPLCTGFGTWEVLPLNPFRPFIPVDRGLLFQVVDHPASQFLQLAFTVNYSLLLFNLLPVFPMDGGRMLQGILWMRMPKMRSLFLAATIGQYGAILMGVGALVWGQFRMFGIALMCLLECRNTLAIAAAVLQRDAAGGPFRPDLRYVEAPRDDAPSDEGRTRKPGFWERRRNDAARKQAEADRLAVQVSEAEVDRILDKIHREGLDSLTPSEQAALKAATERRRAADKL